MKHGDFAHIPGTGPAHARCADCMYLADVSNHRGRCVKAARLRGLPTAKMEKIIAGSLACKHFAERANSAARMTPSLQDMGTGEGG